MRRLYIATVFIVSGILIFSVAMTYMYLEEKKKIEKILKNAYFQSYLPESGRELVKNISAGGCFVYRCYRMNNTMDCYITEGISKNKTCYLSGPTYGLVCRNLTSDWKCYEMSSARRVHYLHVMTPILYYDKINYSCCWITGMNNGKPEYNCTEMTFFDCVNELIK